ncbi:hypothetical protein C8A00DRAFT_42549 [Chaetomidium leptoderma]|uniref:Multiple RNA-binding domain-containing protein 1 n=1 Tax=Chaetomidium leptoderma TaxID=669021 RepID=A0AAN6VNA4_9PEZI|nr:hypothetical protein C8A00DRAFT_42549 [Chaetomidium leptoderma]
MESSRVYVKNLPATISEAEFRKHFSAQGREVTDVKLIPNRRIGFVGYRSHEDAAKAVKYFNRSFIRMSRIGVDLAKPIADSTPRPTARDAPRHGVANAFPKPGAPSIEEPEDENPKKRKREAPEAADPKLQEYLEVMGHPTKKSRDQEALSGTLHSESASVPPPAFLEAGESDDEYENIPARHPKGQAQVAPPHVDATPAPVADGVTPTPAPRDEPAREEPQASANATDDDWLRSRTSRLLDLVDPDDPGFSARPPPQSVPAAAPASEPQAPPRAGAPADGGGPSEGARTQAESSEDAADLVEKTSRLFLRNLSYNVTEDDIRDHFSNFGNLEEVNVPLDNRGQSKGFAMVRYEQPAAAVAAFQTDGSVFQGRIIHILPAAAKRENKLDEFAISKLPLKKQQLLRKKAEAVSSSFNWNALFMSQDAVNTAVAERLGVSKHELLDPTDASAAVKQAVAETTVIQEAKAYFATHGVNIEAFKSQQRGDTSILVKNIRNASIEELRSLFEEHGAVLRVVMPPSGTIAIVQFAQPAACRAAFAKKAYSRFKESVLFLEKGPKGLFVDLAAPLADRPAGVQKPSVAELLERDDAEDQAEAASLFVRNLSFSTTTEGLTNAFKPLDGFVSAQVKTKTDPKKPGQVLSMGFGFCAFKTKEQGQAALKVMDGYVLDGYKLLVKASHRGHDAAEERRREDLAKKAAGQRTKVVIKNLPFEASKKDVRALFSTYGKLVALRLPKKFNHSSRGFAFAEFSTAKEALNALTALKDTHLLGRRLVLDFAEADEVDPEEQIKAMEKKIRGQVNKVTLQQLTGEGRKRLNKLCPLRLISSCVGLILFACLRWRLAPKAAPRSRDAPRQPRGCADFHGGRLHTVWMPLRSSWCPCWTCPEGLGQQTLFDIDPAVALGTMELPVRLPVLPAQCYSPSPDHGFEGRRGVSAPRQPLQESTGNIQHPHMAWYAQHLDALSSMPPLIPPVLRTQSLGPDYGAPPGYPRSSSQQRHKHHPHGRRRSQGINPIMPLLNQAFQNYRKKQADKPDQKWPDELEGHFLDALLLIPKMGRNKYTMKQTLYGRNQLIGEYLWIAYCQSLPPGAEPDPQMMRERKKVSSHIQVLKNFFSNHRCFHFLFGQRQKDKEKDSVEKVSLKNNSVLIALSESRLPDERPNYEYFAQILALNEQIQFRPKRCWIFVSHKDVVVGEDGTGYLPETGGKLGESEYPHLGRNLERETWAKEEQQLFQGALLHEFTKEVHQVESSSVMELSKKWESAFPDLHQRLKAVTSTTTDARCDMLHLHATLELREKGRFLGGSGLSSWVEVSIEQPRLLNHRWKVETVLVRPPELSSSHEDSAPKVVVHEQHKEFSLKYQHRPGCDGSRNDGRGHCDCLSQRSRRDGVPVPFPVPFPADVWAQTLTNCAEYPAHPLSDSKRHERERGSAVKTADDDDEGPRSRRRNKQPTQMDLVPKIAMMQEIWSCPPTASPHGEGSSDSANQRWTRRAVILWTFETIHSMDEGKLVTAQGGRTNWRFLTILDPASEYHQRQAIVSGPRSSAADEYREATNNFGCASRPASRGAVMSPSPTYQQHLGASMNENFSSAWDNTGGLGPLHSSAAAQAAYDAHFMSQTMPSHTGASQTGYGLLDSFSSHSGLATPPPTASLASSFAQQPFDTASTSSDMLHSSYMATHEAVTTAGMDPSSHTLGGGLPAVTDPFLTHVGAAYSEAQDGLHGWNNHGVGSSMDPTSSWTSGYPGASGAHGHNPGMVASWAGSQPQTTSSSSRRGSSHDHHHYPSHPHQHSTRGEEEASQDWVHIHTSSSTTASGGSDLSHDWEEVVAAAAALPGMTKTEEQQQHSALSPSSSSSSSSSAAVTQQQQHGLHRQHHHPHPHHGEAAVGNLQQQQGGGSMLKSLKRARAESEEDDEYPCSRRSRC